MRKTREQQKAELEARLRARAERDSMVKRNLDALIALMNDNAGEDDE
ncbi:MAG: hypothetical protein WC683_04065 [bacterium]